MAKINSITCKRLLHGNGDDDGFNEEMVGGLEDEDEQNKDDGFNNEMDGDVFEFDSRLKEVENIVLEQGDEGKMI